MEKRKKRKKSGDGGYNWMTTYGDMVTLLLTFFVLLFSFSTISEQKWKKLVSAFTGNGSGLIFDNGDETGTDTPVKTPVITPTLTAPTVTATETAEPAKTPSITQTPTNTPKVTPVVTKTPTPGTPKPTAVPTTQKPAPTATPDNLGGIYDEMQGFIDDNHLGADVELIKTEYSIIIRFRDNIMFDPGKADIKPEFLEVLNRFSEVLREYEKRIGMVSIEGHTDNVPISSPEFPTCWELSTARAVAVLRYLIEAKNFNARKIAAVGYGEYHPIDTNSTPEGRARNRRVDFIISGFSLDNN